MHAVLKCYHCESKGGCAQMKPRLIRRCQVQRVNTSIRSFQVQARGLDTTDSIYYSSHGIDVCTRHARKGDTREAT